MSGTRSSEPNSQGNPSGNGASSSTSSAHGNFSRATEPQSPPLQLGTPAQFLKGVGPLRAPLLDRLGIHTAGELLFNFPRGYMRPSVSRPIAELKVGEKVTVMGTIVEVDHRTTSNGRSILGVLIQDETAPLRLVFFNQAYRLDKLRRGLRVVATGIPKQPGVWMEMVHPEPLLTLGPDEPPPTGQILPIYPLTEGLKQSHMRVMVGGLLESLPDRVPEVLPDRLRQSLDLMPIATALREIHQPTSEETLAAGVVASSCKNYSCCNWLWHYGGDN